MPLLRLPCAPIFQGWNARVNRWSFARCNPCCTWLPRHLYKFDSYKLRSKDGYNQNVRNNPLIHIILVIALSFSQLVASVHVAAHLPDLALTDTLTCEFGELPAFATPGHAASLHLAAIPGHTTRSGHKQNSDDSRAHHHHQDHTGKTHSHRHTTDGDQSTAVDYDCAIYHTYASQSGCVVALAPDHFAPQRSAACTPVNAGPSAAQPLRYWHIRAPPMLS